MQTFQLWDDQTKSEHNCGFAIRCFASTKTASGHCFRVTVNTDLAAGEFTANAVIFVLVFVFFKCVLLLIKPSQTCV